VPHGKSWAVLTLPFAQTVDLTPIIYLASTLAGLCGQQLAQGRGRAVRIGLEDAANQ
jgi:hypothetical protein